MVNWLFYIKTSSQQPVPFKKKKRGEVQFVSIALCHSLLCTPDDSIRKYQYSSASINAKQDVFSIKKETIKGCCQCWHLELEECRYKERKKGKKM